MNVVVLDLGVGNIGSLTSALHYLGAPYFVSDDPNALSSSTHAILPGVGAFDPAMRALAARSLAPALHEFCGKNHRPLLGVCLGMQILFEGSDEGSLPGLGLMRGQFKILQRPVGDRHKVPHVGFASLYGHGQRGLFRGLDESASFYFTHSYAMPDVQADCNAAWCRHSQPFVAGFQRGNVSGVQFHPEKSQSSGLRLIANFLESLQ